MSLLRGFLDERKLVLNASKTKILVFNKKRQMDLKMGYKEILEKVLQSFKYLGFTFNRKKDYVDYIKKLRCKKRLTVNKV